MVYDFYECPKRKVLKETLKNGPIRQQRKTLSSLLKANQIITSNTTNDVMDINIFKLSDIINALKCHHNPLPCDNKGSCLLITDVQEVWKQTKQEMKELFGSQEYSSLSIGFFLQELLSDAVHHIDKKQKHFSLYSGHDTTLYPILSLFGVDINFWPPYASFIMIEYMENKSTTYVRILFNGVELKQPWCNGYVCTFDSFKSYLKKNYPKKNRLFLNKSSHLSLLNTLINGLRFL
ncbi:Acid phosphatase [Entamoeba marina]